MAWMKLLQGLVQQFLHFLMAMGTFLTGFAFTHISLHLLQVHVVFYHWIPKLSLACYQPTFLTREKDFPIFGGNHSQSLHWFSSMHFFPQNKAGQIKMNRVEMTGTWKQIEWLVLGQWTWSHQKSICLALSYDDLIIRLISDCSWVILVQSLSFFGSWMFFADVQESAGHHCSLSISQPRRWERDESLEC